MNAKEMLEKKVTGLVSQALQAVESLKNLDGDRKRLTNEKVVAGLKKLGLATQEDLSALEARVAKLEAELRKSTAS